MNIVKKCDFCNKQAVVDGKTRMGPWAYMCPDHLQVYGYPVSLMNTKLVKAYPSTRFNKEDKSNG